MRSNSRPRGLIHEPRGNMQPDKAALSARPCLTTAVRGETGRRASPGDWLGSPRCLTEAAGRRIRPSPPFAIRGGEGRPRPQERSWVLIYQAAGPSRCGQGGGRIRRYSIGILVVFVHSISSALSPSTGPKKDRNTSKPPGYDSILNAVLFPWEIRRSHATKR